MAFFRRISRRCLFGLRAQIESPETISQGFTKALDGIGPFMAFRVVWIPGGSQFRLPGLMGGGFSAT